MSNRPELIAERRSPYQQVHEGGWTDERIERLKALWLEGKSASQIAAALGDGVTRSGVCAKVSRLRAVGAGLPQRQTAEYKSRSLMSVRATRPRAAKKLPKAAAIVHRLEAPAPLKPAPAPRADAFTPIPGTTPVRLLDLGKRQCRYVVSGDEHPVLFCGQPTEGETSWCAAHAVRIVSGRAA